MKKYILGISFIAVTSIAYAQEGYEHLSPIAHGAGRTYVVTSRGLSAVGLNPSLLGLDDDKNIEIHLFPVSSFGVDAGSSFSSVSALSSVFNFSAPIDSARSKQIANLLSNNNLSGSGDAEVFGIAYRVPEVGKFAFTWTTHAGLRTDIPQSFIDFFLNAETNLIKHSNSIENFDLQGMWYSEYSLSFGKNIELGKDTSSFLKNISIGGAVKYVSGIAYFRVNEGNYINSTPQTNRVIIGLNFDEFSSYSSNFDPSHVPNHFSFDFLTSNSAGSGIGADIGICAGFFSNKHGTPTVLLGMSATDIGSISWNTNATERIADHIIDTINYGTAQKIQDVTDSLKKLSGTLKNVSSFTTSLPSTFRAGLEIDLDAMGIDWAAMAPRIAIEYSNGLTNLVGSLKSGRLGAGITLERTGNIGFRISGGFVIQSDASDITLGAGVTLFKFLDIDIASARALQLLQSSNARTDLALAIRAAF